MPILPIILCIFAGGFERATFLGATVPDVALFDSHGTRHNLSEGFGQRGTIVYFFASGCPLAKLYTPRMQSLAAELKQQGITLIGVASQPTDSLAEVESFSRRHRLTWPAWKDRNGELATALGVRRTPEVIVLNGAHRIVYRGRIDDQYQPGLTRATATTHDLRDALDDIRAGKPVSRPLTEPAGCLLGRAESSNNKSEVVYTRDIAAILQNHCVACHRPGQIGPFPLTSYEEAASWGPMIREVVEAGRMPPWHANPKYGHFANDRRLGEREKQRISTWVANGCPQGNQKDLPPPMQFSEEWSIPTPHAVLSLPEPVQIPSEGVMDYQYFEIDPGFTEERWVQAAEVLPTCRAVVHHCNVFLKPPTKKPLDRTTEAEWTYLTVLTPGKPPSVLPERAAKRWPAGWKAVIVIHYSPNGTPQVDQTKLGLVFADPASVHKEISTHFSWDTDIAIPPGASDYTISHKFTCVHDTLLYAIFPHMHLRGKSFRTEAVYPDGRREILLDVPRYDFAWQNHYVLAEPLRLPEGTVLRYTSIYDNSSANPANPDPTVWVRTGPQSWDEMFNAYLDVALADQDLPADTVRAGQRLAGLLSVAGVTCLACVFLWRRQARIRAKSAWMWEIPARA